MLFKITKLLLGQREEEADGVHKSLISIRELNLVVLALGHEDFFQTHHSASLVRKSDILVVQVVVYSPLGFFLNCVFYDFKQGVIFRVYHFDCFINRVY